jgi:decaprenylphospho-beta-D-ribofuranose 2-oxidase
VSRSPAEPAPPAAGAEPGADGDGRGEARLLTGWGLTAPTRAEVRRPGDAAEVVELLRGAGERGVIARGLGRAYGDAAQNAGGTVIDARGLSRVRDIDLAAGRAVVEAGVSLDALIGATLPLGWFPDVVPGTRHVTVGGAIASDIHGKNHHRDGAFGDHVLGLELATPAGEVVECGPDREPELFAATTGGMGLTGVVTAATLRLSRLETSWMRVDTERAHNLDDVLARMEARDHEYRYSVAWVDCLARGAALGRSVLTRGDHAGADELGAERREAPLAPPPAARLAAPRWVPDGLLNRSTVAVFNEVYFRRAPRAERGRLEPLHSFFFPLDVVRGWNRMYGPRGFLQYQVVVPFEAGDALRAVLERLSQARCASFLGVLKRFGRERGLISFPMPGWTLAVDVATSSPGLAGLLDELDLLVAEAGGRVYLSKDSRLRPELVPQMYPRLEEWRAIRARVDPEGRMRSDLARRLRLDAGAVAR